MAGAHLSPYPHYSWLAHWLRIGPPRVFDLHECRHVTHRIVLTTEGVADVAWRTNGTDARFRVTLGDIGFFPCDRAEHVFAFTTSSRYRAVVVCIPERQLLAPAAVEIPHAPDCFRAIPVFQDALIQASVARLSAAGGRQPISALVGDEIAARHVLLRLSEIIGAGVPEWPRDTSAFSSDEMRRIVDRVDAHISRPMSLAEVCDGFGLSSGHFARKFEVSAGVSLNRFVNRRRIGFAMGMLETGNVPISQLSIDLGFSSQSHFTRVFRGLIGITPWQFRRMQSRSCDAD